MLWLLREGRLPEALDAYRVPMLSRSKTMVLQLLRDRLDLALGAAVRSSGDAGLISRWLSTDMGSADAFAVEALGRLGRDASRLPKAGGGAIRNRWIPAPMAGSRSARLTSSSAAYESIGTLMCGANLA
ncbi:UNVERIFIED_ORG: hypothetical protein ABIB13_002502 [Arthrobacter sp. UYEF2]